MAEQSTVQSLDRAFDLLETLCRSRNGMSIGGLSAETGLHKSTVHRLLASMCARGYVQRDAETSVYRAGMRLCEMSSYIVDNLDIVERARASLERLEQCTDETVHLVMRDDKDIVYIHKVDNGVVCHPHVLAHRHAPAAVLYGRWEGNSCHMGHRRGARRVAAQRCACVDRAHHRR